MERGPARKFYVGLVEELIEFVEVAMASAGTAIAPPHLRAELRSVTRWFCDLHDARRYVRTTEPEAPENGSPGIAWRVHCRPERIAYRDITAWAKACGVALAPWQLAALTLIDDLFIERANKPKGQLEAPTKEATTDNMKNLFSFFEK